MELIPNKRQKKKTVCNLYHLIAPVSTNDSIIKNLTHLSGKDIKETGTDIEDNWGVLADSIDPQQQQEASVPSLALSINSQPILEPGTPGLGL